MKVTIKRKNNKTIIKIKDMIREKKLEIRWGRQQDFIRTVLNLSMKRRHYE